MSCRRSARPSASTRPARCPAGGERRHAARTRDAVAVARRSTTAAAPSFGRAQHPEVQRLAHDPAGQHLVGGHGLAGTWRSRVVDAVRPGSSRTTAARSSLVRPRVAHQALGPQGEVGGRGGEPGLLLPGLEERRADHPLRHLLDAEDEHAFVLAGGDRACAAELQRGAAAGAPGLDVDDRACPSAPARRARGARWPPRRRRCRSRRPGTPPAPTPASASAARTAWHAEVDQRSCRRSARTGACRPRRSRPALIGTGREGPGARRRRRASSVDERASAGPRAAAPGRSRSAGRRRAGRCRRARRRRSRTAPARRSRAARVTAVHARAAGRRESSTRSTSSAPVYGHTGRRAGSGGGRSWASTRRRSDDAVAVAARTAVAIALHPLTATALRQSRSSSVVVEPEQLATAPRGSWLAEHGGAPDGRRRGSATDEAAGTAPAGGRRR